MYRPKTLRVLVYGPPHTNKSTFAASAPKPICVWLHDPPDKGLPYLRECAKVDELQWPLLKVGEEDIKVTVERGFDAEGNLMVQVEHYGEHEEHRHLMMQAYLSRMELLRNKELRAESKFKTFVLDSFTFAEAASIERAKVDNPIEKEGQRFNLNWAAAAAAEMTGLVWVRFPKWRDVNVVVVAHEGEKEYGKGEVVIRGIQCYGKLVKNITSAYGEVYHTKVVTETVTDPKTYEATTSSKFVLQTVFEAPFDAGSLIGAPNACEPTWEAVWGVEDDTEKKDGA